MNFIPPSNLCHPLGHRIPSSSFAHSNPNGHSSTKTFPSSLPSSTELTTPPSYSPAIHTLSSSPSLSVATTTTTSALASTPSTTTNITKGTTTHATTTSGSPTCTPTNININTNTNPNPTTTTTATTTTVTNTVGNSNTTTNMTTPNLTAATTLSLTTPPSSNSSSIMSTSFTTGSPPYREQFSLKAGLAQMLKGGVIMDVTNVEQARIAEEAGAVAVMALERVPSDIRKQGGVARMSDPQMIKAIKAAVSIPVMAKVRIGHFVEAQILQALRVDYIDESEVLTPADPLHHIDKHEFQTPFVCGCRNLGEALRRIHEGAAMIRTKGEAGTGNVVEAVRHARTLLSEIRYLQALSRDERYHYAKDIQAPLELLNETARLGRLPVVNFAAGGIATPADAAMMMQLGMDGVFVGSGIFKSSDPLMRARAIVQAVTHYKDANVLAQVSENLGDAMSGLDIQTLPLDQTYSLRGH